MLEIERIERGLGDVRRMSAARHDVDVVVIEPMRDRSAIACVLQKLGQADRAAIVDAIDFQLLVMPKNNRHRLGPGAST